MVPQVDGSPACVSDARRKLLQGTVIASRRRKEACNEIHGASARSWLQGRGDKQMRCVLTADPPRKGASKVSCGDFNWSFPNATLLR